MPNIIVIGASAGGVEPLRQVVRALPPDLQAAIFIVMHVSPLNPSMLPSILRTPKGLKVSAAVDGASIAPGHVYVAQPDLHLLVEPGYIHLTRGPRENRHRPAIDPLFRSAARAYGPRVLGIVLTGMLDDGALGLHIIKAEGGIAIVQEPDEAMFDSMPLNAIKAANVDYVLKVADIPGKIVELVREPWQPVESARAKDILREFPRPEGEKMSEQYDERMNGKPSIFTCPDCSGTLWEVEDGDLLRFRCRVGHAFSPEAMRNGYTDSVEGALWSAVRILEESASLERRLAADAAARGDELTADRFSDVALGREEQAAMIRDMLMSKRSPEEKANEIA
jgi:two-component system, chemotaxis family, protein-glutamate methylesterase/glutaminase